MSIKRQAAEWDARLRSPDCSAADRARFLEWRQADPEHGAVFDRLQMFVSVLRGAGDQAPVRPVSQQPVRRPRVWLAAACLLALTCGLLAQSWWRHSPSADGSVVKYATPIGERLTARLTDGSSIELDARSLVEVRFSAGRRDVTLVSGQVLFRVAADPQRPFVVKAADRNIVAVGTSFDVQLDAAAVRVTLLEGRVHVDRVDGGHRDVLNPGQQLLARVGDPADIDIRAVDVARATSWRDGRVYLEDLPLRDAVAEMNRYSEVQVVVEGADLETIRVNGMFRAGDQQAFANALEAYFPVEVVRPDAQHILFRARK